jgi:predicted dehydrogenase/nucleoside-diphosphate-sugar epimerase
LKVAIIGSGHIAEVHGPSILKQPEAKIVAVVDKDISRAEAMAEKLKAEHSYQDAERMISELNPDVVHVLVPPQYHAQLSIMAMNKGCHVLVEKPMALSMHDAVKMAEIAKINNVSLCVNHNLVFDDVVQSALKLVSTGILGKVLSVEANLLFNAERYPEILEEGAEYCHWTYRMNGGPLQDLIPHPASLVFELIPDIKEIKFIGQNRGVLPEAWHDELKILINSSSVMGYLNISLSERPDTVSLTIRGKKATVQADLYNNILIFRKETALPRAVNRGMSGFQLGAQNLKGALKNIHNFLTGRIDKSSGIELLISKFYKSIYNGEAPPIAIDKSLRVMELMTQIWPKPLIDVKNIQSIPYPSGSKRSAPTALVTGASGFIGNYLVKKLISENINVRALVRPNSIHAGRLAMLDVEIIQGDLSDPKVLNEATRGIKTIYHAGSPTSNNWGDYERVAIKGTEYLIEAALAQQVDRFMQFSSLVVYELLDIKNRNIKEDSPYQKKPKRMGAYAWAKIETEKLVFNAYKSEGLGVTIIRPGIVFGPLGRVFFPHLGYNLMGNTFLLIGKGDIPLPLTYVENTVDGIFKASISEKAIGQAYNLVDDGEITAKSYLEKYVKINSNQARIIHLPYILPYGASLAYEILAYLGFVRKGVTSRAQLKWKQSKVRFDNTKAKSELGWAPKISLEEGLTRTFKWYALKYSPKE